MPSAPVSLPTPASLPSPAPADDLADPYVLAHYAGARPTAPAWFTAAIAHQPERGRFVSQGAEIELLTWGEAGKPGLLFLHGNGAHADWWSPLAPFFAGQWRCGALSWSGMGRSDRRAEGYDVTLFAQEARDAIAAARLDEAGPCMVIGHSFGGMVGLFAAASNPAVRGLVVIDSPLGMSRERVDVVRARAPRAYPAHRPFATIADGLARFRLSPPQPCVNDFMADHIARHGLVEENGAWVWHFDPRRVTMRKNALAPPVADVACPIAYLHGDRSTLINAETLATTRAALPPETPFITIPDSAHHVPLDQPLALVAALRALLATWPAPGQGWPHR
ncbi:alpha/beta fold hydrolase [Novosphingobium bradum]|uniref:Alpha/beta fold hydrolase n=1 Tax=Novosphingobium bradum TaxID=1737444 RepID=A0ABV7IKC3_9SPHN